VKKPFLITGLALLLAPVALVAGYFGFQRYLNWLMAGAKRPLTGPRYPPDLPRGAARRPRAEPDDESPVAGG
jgi:hypothetical protein